MEGLAGATSVLAVVQLAAEVAKLCGGYIRDVKNAPDDVQCMTSKVTTLREVLERLEKYPDKGQHQSALKQCHTALDSIKKRLEPLQPSKKQKAMRRLGLRALKWPFTSKEVDENVATLDGYLHIFNSVLLLDLNTKVIDSEEERHLEKLAYVSGASFSNQRHRSCLENTRVNVLQKIERWAVSPSPQGIFWLKGMAGNGKSTVAISIATHLQKTSCYLVTFFFRRGFGDLAHARKLLPTIVHQFSVISPTYRHYVVAAVRAEPDLGQSANLKEQYEKLIVRPLRAIRSPTVVAAMYFIVIDALDECEEESDLRLLLRLLASTKEMASLNLRIVVTSRPEWVIEQGFDNMPSILYENLVLHDVPRPEVDRDIEVFLRYELAIVRKDRQISQPWPKDPEITTLVGKAAGLFIFADTACRYIAEPPFADFTQSRLAEVCSLVAQNHMITKDLDQMYTIVLQNAFKGTFTEEEQKQLSFRFNRVVGSIVMLLSPLPISELHKILRHLQLNSQQSLEEILRPLHAVIDVPKDTSLLVQPLHLSFRDFLLDRQRCLDERFQIKKEQTHQRLALDCVHLLSISLRKNMCQLQSSMMTMKKMNQGDINLVLSPAVQYSCRYWVAHLQEGEKLLLDHGHIDTFLRAHFLHWLEAMSLMKRYSEAIVMMVKLKALVDPQVARSLHTLVNDCHRFLMAFRQVISTVPLQTYESALFFSPLQSVVRRLFTGLMPENMTLRPAIPDNWNASLHALEGHSEWVTTVVFSPDGRLVASGSNDETVRLWDTATGESRAELRGHSDRVTTVVFSPDGRLVASGSNDKSVRLWDTATGESQAELRGHSKRVITVVFSPDGRLVASGSMDTTVRLWDTVTGESRAELRGHSSSVTTVVFSPDSRLVASGSVDKTVRLWDTATSESQAELQDHSSRVTIIVFSPDGRLVASGSNDETVRLWDTATGASRAKLRGHSGWVTTVVFSPDGRLVASGSDDKIVRLWDTATGESQAELRGHSGRITTVVFSPDGMLVASGSDDEIVRLWDTATGESRAKLQGHSGWVTTVVFSPDSRLVASGSDDKTVRLWDTATGESRAELQDHSSTAITVVFSPDGRLVASGSADKTVCLWDTATGESRAELRGHSSTVTIVVFSPDSRLVASGSVDVTVRLWDTATGESRAELRGHSSTVTTVVFSPDGRLVASGSDDKTVRLWDVQSAHHKVTVSVHDYQQHISVHANLLLVNGKAFGVHDGKETTYPAAGLVEAAPGTMIYRDGWILRGSRQVLWLPPEYRPHIQACHGDQIALGFSDGSIKFFSWHD